MIEKIIRDLEVIYHNKQNRLHHVYGVRETALKLGKKYNCDLNKLELAALLHDITKYYSIDENIRIIKDNFVEADKILKDFNIHILHAFSAYVVARDEYGIEDEDILNAIKNHTIGKENMSIYEKIIFISDYTEPNRTYDSCIKVRNILDEDIDLAVFTAIDDSIKFYEKNDGEIPKSAYKARDFYQHILEEKHEKN